MAMLNEAAPKVQTQHAFIDTAVADVILNVSIGNRATISAQAGWISVSLDGCHFVAAMVESGTAWHIFPATTVTTKCEVTDKEAAALITAILAKGVI